MTVEEIIKQLEILENAKESVGSPEELMSIMFEINRLKNLVI